MGFWELMMDKGIGALKDEKISLGVLVIGAFAFYHLYTWADDNHNQLVKRPQFEQEIEKLTKLMTDHTEEFRITNASQIIRDLEMQLQIAEATSRTEAEINHLKIEISNAKMYRTCLIDRRPNCKHLKPPE